MPLKHISTVLTACFLASTALAVDVRLGPETPLARTLEIVPAAYNQESPDVASNGEDFLAVWIDRRTGGYEAPLFASRLDADGKPLEPLGRMLAQQARFPQVASDGSDYLVAWNSGAGSFLLRVDADAGPLAAPRRLSDQFEPRALASNGSTYLLIETQRNRGGASPSTATILDRDGAPLQTIGAFGTFVWAGAHDGHYVLIEVPNGCSQGCQGRPMLHTIESSGGWRVTSSVSLQVTPDAAGSYFTAVASPDHVLIVKKTSGPDTSNDGYRIFDYEGAIVKTRTPLAGDVIEVGAGWDGREFLVAVRTVEKTEALRVSNDGRTVSEPFILTNEWGPVPKFASSASKLLLLWADRRLGSTPDVFARVAADFASLAISEEEVSLVSYSGVVQDDVQVASSPAGLLGVWRESNGAIRGALNGVSIAFTPDGFGPYGPSVVAGSRNFLVVWFAPRESKWDVHAKRVAFDGRILDEQPLILATDLEVSIADNPGLAWDGSRFLAAFAAQKLYLVHVNDDGTIGERRIVNFDQASPRWPDPVWTGTDFLVPYAAVRWMFGCDICPPDWMISLERPGITGNAGGFQSPPLFDHAGSGHALKIVAAADGNRVTLAWMQDEKGIATLHVAQLSRDGKVLTAPFRMRDLPGVAADTLALAWNGSEYVLAWSERAGAIRALRLDTSARAIDLDPFLVAPHFSRITIAPNAAGVSFGYRRVDEASGHVTRAFTRTLDRIVTAPRKRSVRR